MLYLKDVRKTQEVSILTKFHAIFLSLYFNIKIYNMYCFNSLIFIEKVPLNVESHAYRLLAHF